MIDDCVICGKETSSESLGVPICSNKECVKEWFAMTYIERVNLIAQYQSMKGDEE